MKKETMNNKIKIMSKIIMQQNDCAPDALQTLVWIRIDGFVQCIKEDVIITSSILGCVLTERPDNKIKLTGFNENMLDKYLPKVIKKGYPVVICDL